MRRLLRQLAEIWTGEKTLHELLEWRRCGGVHFSRGYGNTFFRDEVSPRDNVKDGGNVENARIGCDVSNIDSTFKESGKGNDHCIALFASVRVRHLGFPSIYLCYLPSRFFLSSPSSASLTGSRLTYILATCGCGRGPGRNHLNKRAWHVVTSLARTTEEVRRRVFTNDQHLPRTQQRNTTDRIQNER